MTNLDATGGSSFCFVHFIVTLAGLKNNVRYYPTVLVTVQKARETSTNIPRYCTVGYPVTFEVCFQVTEKVEKGYHFKVG